MGIMEKMRLDGKRSFVTGGARGIGKAIATALAEAGSDVALLDVDIATAQQTAAEIAQATGRVIRAYEVDVTQEAQVDAVVQQLIEDLGGLDCAFCNAGICLNVPAAENDPCPVEKRSSTSTSPGCFSPPGLAGRYMIRQGKGSIVNTASMSAHIVNVPQPQCSYNASKAGVIQLTKSLAIEWAPYGVRVNSISPGYIGTELTLQSESLKPLISQWNAMAPLHRLGKPEELQAIAVYLAGDASPFTTGSDFVIDGAFTCF